MAHYALLTIGGVVEQVIVGEDETTPTPDGFDSWESLYSTRYGMKCVRTSYNGRIRKQYAGIGFVYDENADVFIAPRPFASWTLDENHDWQPPIPMPEDGVHYIWDESMLAWVDG